MGNGINRYITDNDPILRYESQTLTEEQKSLAKENIGAASIDHDHSDIREAINQLDNKIGNIDVSEEINSAVSNHNSDAEAHADIRELIDTNSGKVTQNPTSADDEDYRVLLSGTADDESHTEATKKSDGLKYNPNTGVLKVSAIDMGIGVIKTNSELSAFVLEFN